MKLFNKVAIVGVGLIGGSIGLAIKKRKLASKVIGIGRHRKSINEALKRKTIDAGYLDIRKIKDADLVILATPVGAIKDLLFPISKVIKKGCIVIDVGSAKLEIMNIAVNIDIDFVGCHPIAGLEKKGPRNAQAGIFQNSLCLLTPPKKTKKDILSKVRLFWEELGSKTKILDAAWHDRILAFVSHMPHAVVFSLIDCIDFELLGFASGGLKDTTRIASSDPHIWRDIFMANKKEVLAAIKKFKKSLHSLESLIKNNQPDKLESFLKKNKRKRDAP